MTKPTALVYYETTTDVRAAIEREKQIKDWRRSKRVALIQRMNPTWRDLSDDFAEEALDSSLSGELGPSANTPFSAANRLDEKTGSE